MKKLYRLVATTFLRRKTEMMWDGTVLLPIKTVLFRRLKCPDLAP